MPPRVINTDFLRAEFSTSCGVERPVTTDEQIRAKTLHFLRTSLIGALLVITPGMVYSAQDFEWVCNSGEFDDHECWSGSGELPQSVDTVIMPDDGLFATIYDPQYMDIIGRYLYRVAEFKISPVRYDQDIYVRQYSSLRVAEDLSLLSGEGGDVDWYIGLRSGFGDVDPVELEVGDRLHIKSTLGDTSLGVDGLLENSLLDLTANRIRVQGDRSFSSTNKAQLHVWGRLVTNELNISGKSGLTFTNDSTQVALALPRLFEDIGNSSIGSMIIGEDDDEAGMFTLVSEEETDINELAVGKVQVGRFGAGVFDQRGGIVRGKDNTSRIVLGNGTGGHGTYYLKHGEINLSTGTVSSVDVGNYGVGEFIQTNGAHHSSNVVVARESSANGSYYQITGGSLTVDGSLIVGLRGTGTFIQNGGHVDTHRLYVAAQAGSDDSAYNLNGADIGVADLCDQDFICRLPDLKSNLLEIDSGSFVHDGGYHSTDTLRLKSGRYDLLSGVFSVGSTSNGSGTGTINIDGGTLRLSYRPSPTSVYEIDRLNIASRTGSVGDFSFFSLRRLNLGSLIVGAGGIGTMTQHGDIDVAGTMTVGYYTPGVVGNHAYLLRSGDLVSDELIIGHIVDAATFTQDGGTHTTTNMTIGNYASTGNITYVHNRGETTVTNQLGLGFRNTTGIYELNGGTLNVGTIWNGSGTSILYLNGGTLKINGAFANADILSVGSTDRAGFFSLEAGKSMTSEYALINHGVYTQNGGTFTTGALSIGRLSGKTAIYDFRGGLLTANSLSSGAGDGRLYMNGGKLNLAEVSINVDVFKVASEETISADFELFAGQSVTAGELETGLGGEFRNQGLVSYSGEFTNKGTFHNEFGGALTNDTMLNNNGTLTNNFDTELLNNFGATIINSGRLVNTFGGTLSNNGIVKNSGTVRLDPNSVMQGSGRFYQTAGELIVNGTVTQDSVEIAGGMLSGYGTVESSVSLTGGQIGPDNSPGTLLVDGNFSMDEFSTLAFELGGTTPGRSGYDVLNVSGTAFLAGELEVRWYDFGSGLFNAGLGDSFDLLSAESINGEFDVLSYALLGDGLDWQLDYLADEIGSTDILRLSVVSQVPEPATGWLLGAALLSLLMLQRRERAVHHGLPPRIHPV